ncbi:MAG TPA: response regulator transcription factor [Gaiellaceae bacterium]|nr:response regulator transcription factor [Gaiellaceae bacterium]
MKTILVVDDEPIVRDVVAKYLRHEGFRTVEAAESDTAKVLFELESPSLVVLDVMMPGTDGLSFCRWIRARADTPVILLTALGEEADRIVGLELGADDYLTKPFSPRELTVRVKTVLRRAAAPRPREERIVVGDLEIDAGTRGVTKAGTSLKLTAREFDLLWFLATNPKRVFSRTHLLDRVWGDDGDRDSSTVTVHMRRLREKVERDPSRPRHLETVWGIGYRLTP